jgi:hypothetical protein
MFHVEQFFNHKNMKIFNYKKWGCIFTMAAITATITVIIFKLTFARQMSMWVVCTPVITWYGFGLLLVIINFVETSINSRNANKNQ